MMTRKDFELIAAAIRDSRPHAYGAPHERVETVQFDRTATEVAIALSETNPRFDRGRFLAACGVEVEA